MIVHGGTASKKATSIRVSDRQPAAADDRGSGRPVSARSADPLAQTEGDVKDDYRPGGISLKHHLLYWGAIALLTVMLSTQKSLFDGCRAALRASGKG